jgi:hypothetical protein
VFGCVELLVLFSLELDQFVERINFIRSRAVSSFILGLKSPGIFSGRFPISASPRFLREANLLPQIFASWSRGFQLLVTLGPSIFPDFPDIETVAVGEVSLQDAVRLGTSQSDQSQDNLG